MHVQGVHLGGDVLPTSRLPIDCEGRRSFPSGQVAADNKVGLALGALQLDFDVTSIFSLFNEGVDLLSASKKL